MIKSMFRISLVFSLALFATFMTSCDKESTVSDEIVQNFVNGSIESMERQGNCGRGGCFEFVFPLTVEYPDGTTGSTDSYEALRTAIAAWKEANPDAEDKPTLAFPIEVISEDGAVITITTQEELIALKKECRRNFKKNHSKGDICFDLVFPLNIVFPDGTTTEYADRMLLKEGVRTWKEANPDAEERPTLAFPLDITMEDGTVVTIASAEELQAQKETCAGS